MSGGSYEYLCHTFDFDRLLGHEHQLERMAARLAGLGYAKDAARETEELLLLLRQWDVRAMARVERLKDVWKAVEWWDSCDWNENHVKEALTEYRGDEGQAGA